MEAPPDCWVTETQSSLKGATTASLSGQHSRLRRAQARSNWYNIRVSNDGQLIKPFKFVDQQELKSQNNSKLLSSIRSHVRQDTYMKQQLVNTDLGNKRKYPHHLHVRPKIDRAIHPRTKDAANDDDYFYASRNINVDFLYSSGARSYRAGFNSSSFNDLFTTFAGYGPLNRPRALFLIRHYREAANEAWYPEAVEACLNWSKSNMILLHVILYCAACHFRVITNSKDYSDILYYRGEAMKLINRSLDDPAARIGNKVIGGLCHLVMAEEMYGCRLAAAVHRKGIQKLFELRRALPGTSMNSIVRHLLPLTNFKLPSGTLLLTPRINLLGEEADEQEHVARQDLILDVFSWLKDTPLELPINPSETECRSAIVRVKLEYNIYSQNHGDASSKSRRCWLLAALIYLHTIIATPEGWHLLPVTEKHLIEELRELMEEITQPLEATFNFGVHLWILLFGGVHATERDSAWYREAMRRVSEAQHLSGWNDFKLIIKSLPWVQENVEGVLKDFYETCAVVNLV